MRPNTDKPNFSVEASSYKNDTMSQNSSAVDAANNFNVGERFRAPELGDAAPEGVVLI